ncbi:expressed unknown protein [Seminavis robusta]|uniref:Transmembrane protein n=1 Tax=Seminavis robusta TaxID=568900 RepID=A0A9N8DUB9_9STRA|nr:expressed unknown protein [Seminavis robusta]|eukprot:Sro356_g125410.1 n/a (122) ;mRNA; f:53368-53733
MSSTITQRPTRRQALELHDTEDHLSSASSSSIDLEMNLSFEDFQEQVVEDYDDNKKYRKHQKRATLSCAVTFLGLCALLVFAVNKTLIEADASVSRRTPTLPVQRYKAPLVQQNSVPYRRI